MKDKFDEINPVVVRNRNGDLSSCALGKIPQRNGADLSSYIFGKIPPQAKELEEAVLGACMLESDAVMAAVTILKPEYFYVHAHQLIFSAFVRLLSKNAPVDILTVVQDLKENSSLEAAGGPFAITQLTARIASGANVEHHALIVKQQWMKREVIRVCSSYIKDAYEDTADPFDLVGNAAGELSAVLDSNHKSTTFFASQLAKNILDADAAAKNEEKYVVGLGSGIYSLDRVTLGFCPGDLVIIAGRPGDGKTTLGLHIVRECALHDVPVGLFSLEMSSGQLVNKLIAMHGLLPLRKIRSGTMDSTEWQKYHQIVTAIEDWSIYLNDDAGIGITELCAIAKGWKSKFGIKLLVVDYLQLIGGDTDDRKIQNREQEIASITRRLKKLAKALEIPVIALSQLSRQMEHRGKTERRPVLADLRESGSIEQDADLVIFVFRPDCHGIKDYEDGFSTQNIIEFIVAKNRNGGLDNVLADYLLDVQRFDDSRYSRYAKIKSNDEIF